MLLEVNIKCSKTLFNPETPISIEKRHPYAGNLKSETPGTVKTRLYIVKIPD